MSSRPPLPLSRIVHLRLALITVGVKDLAARLGGQCPPGLRADGVYDKADRAVDQGDVDAAGIFERLGCSAQGWQSRMERLRDGRLLGRFFATTRAQLREIAERLGMRRPVNVVGYPV
jgi:hypothetical protein